MNTLDVKFHGYILQTIYTTVFQVKRINNRALSRGINLLVGNIYISTKCITFMCTIALETEHLAFIFIPVLRRVQMKYIFPENRPTLRLIIQHHIQTSC